MVMRQKYVPSKGDIVWLQFSPHAGNEPAGHRPALCISPIEYNKKVGLALFCPITSIQKGYPFEVLIPLELPINGVILADHVKNLDWKTRNVNFICSLPTPSLETVLAKLKTLLS